MSTGPKTYLILLLATIGFENAHAKSCVYPIVVESAITDIHENGMNGPWGFAYFVGAPGVKTGEVPAMIGGESFDTNIWASNFQGPELLKDKRDQHEWTADGQLQVSKRKYPLVFQHRCYSKPSEFQKQIVKVKEDDEGWSPNDEIGAFEVDLTKCAPVLSRAREGWTEIHLSKGLKYNHTKGPADIKYVAIKYWCYQPVYSQRAGKSTESPRRPIDL
ncbi:MAG: hypothetical protein ABL958_02465 [Bdellovibrionia bacterium]